MHNPHEPRAAGPGGRLLEPDLLAFFGVSEPLRGADLTTAAAALDAMSMAGCPLEMAGCLEAAMDAVTAALTTVRCEWAPTGQSRCVLFFLMCWKG